MQQPVKSSPPARPSRSGAGLRWLLHGSLALLLASAGGVGLVWPQWIAAEGSRSSLEIEREKVRGLEDRLDTVRAINSRLRSPRNEASRLCRLEQVHLLPRLVRDLAKQAGAEVLEARVAGIGTTRFRSVALETDGEATGGAPTEVRPARVQIALTGSFESVYQTIGSLCEGQQLFVPERWQITPRPGTKLVKAQVAAAVFVLETKPEETPVAPPGPVGAVAAALPVRSQQ